MDETWIHHYTPETKRSSAEWTATGENRPKRPGTAKSYRRNWQILELGRRDEGEVRGFD